MEYCITSSCIANAGNIVPSQFTYCEGSPSLDLSIPVDFGGNEPNPATYDYYFVIADEDELILDFQEDPDLTSFSPGTYTVCGLSVLAADFSQIPTPNGSFSLDDLQQDIDDELYCADLSDDCWTIIIVGDNSNPQILGPDTACIGELVTFMLDGIDVDDWTSGTVSGPFNELEFDLPEITVNWALGSPTRDICYSWSNVCGSGEVCITVDVIQPPNIEKTGPTDVCEDTPYTYELDPPVPPSASWDITLTGGTLINVDDNSFEAEWFENGGDNTATVVLVDGPCGDSDPVVLSVNIIDPDPPILNLPNELCLDEVGQASVDFDPLIDNYTWSGTGITILSGTAEICLNEEVSIVLEVDGPLPLDIVLQNNTGNQIEVTLENESEMISYVPQSPGEEIWEVFTVDFPCDAVLDGNFTVSVIEPVDFQILPPPEICNNALFGSLLDLSTLINEPTDGVWSINGMEITDGVIDFDGFDESQYVLEFSTIGFESPCPGSTEVVEIWVVDCNCPEVDLPESIDVCANSDPIDLSDLSGESVQGEWELQNPNGLELVPELVEGLLVIEENVEGGFALVFTISDSLPDECPVEWQVDLNVEGIKSAGISNDPLVICEGQDSLIDLSSLLSDKDPGGQWFNEMGDSVESGINSSLLILGTNTFNYRISGENCPSIENEVVVVVNEVPIAELNWLDPICFGEENGEITAEIQNSTNPPYSIRLNGLQQSGLNAFNLTPGTYEVEILDGNNCSSESQTVVLEEPVNYNVDLGEDLFVNVSELVRIQAETNLPDANIANVEWFENGEILEAETQLDIDFIPLSNTTLSIRLTTDQGCVIEDQIQLNIREQTVYIPNVFRPTSDINPNSVFGPLGTETVNQIISFQIFDRWGNQVHSVTNISPESLLLFWDGTFRGETASEGVYVFQLVYLALDGTEVIRSGEVTLIR